MTKSPRTLFLYPTKSRLDRLSGVDTGDTPRDFYYGYLDLKARGHDVTMVDSQSTPSTSLSRARMKAESWVSGITNLGFNSQRVAAIADELIDSDIALAFTDSFSLSLGLYASTSKGRPIIAGGFHGLADLADRAPVWLRPHARRKIRRALSGLDHAFFFGEADRQQSIKMYGLDPDKTSLFLFGVDTDFWCPADAGQVSSHEPGVLSVGSDPKRDYRTLIDAGLEGPVRILTRLDLNVPSEQTNIEIIRGSYHNRAVTDVTLRDIYRDASIVAIPLLNVYQPTGYSVTLQAMACGKPVVLSRIQGLWDPDVFVSGVNCMLVDPQDPVALREAVSTLQNDDELRESMGAAARQSAVEHFGLERMNVSAAQLIERLATEIVA